MDKMIGDIVGFTGVFLCLLAYWLAYRFNVNTFLPFFMMMQIVASLCILFSLSYDFNLPVFVLEIAWLVISLKGLLKCFFIK
jgi:hypothetical protein